MRFSNEIKAGLVVAVAIAVAAVFLVKTASFKKETYDLKTFFEYAGDLKPNAIVKLSGIEVGRVREIAFTYDQGTMVECTLEIETDAKVRKDSIAYIATSGFVGDAYVGLTPGGSEEFVIPGDIVKSEDPVQSRIIMKKADNIADSLDKILVKVKEVVTDNQKNLDEIVVNITDATENLKEFSEDLKKHPWKLMFKGE
ncbi:MAG: MlaD family protein [Candidatus Omnitrophota bacterium]|nr:MCE family protein [Candidatus Omnitrophota bacterium]